MDERVAAQVAPPKNLPWHRRPELLVIVALLLLAHLPRLSVLPVCGEESRWATVARGMIDSGDWIVPRQQGQVFPDRPPLGVWPIAALASLRGEVDSLAIGLPSVIAVTLTSVVVFAYGSMFPRLLPVAQPVVAGRIYRENKQRPLYLLQYQLGFAKPELNITPEVANQRWTA